MKSFFQNTLNSQKVTKQIVFCSYSYYQNGGCFQLVLVAMQKQVPTTTKCTDICLIYKHMLFARCHLKLFLFVVMATRDLTIAKCSSGHTNGSCLAMR